MCNVIAGLVTEVKGVVLIARPTHIRPWEHSPLAKIYVVDGSDRDSSLYAARASEMTTFISLHFCTITRSMRRHSWVVKTKKAVMRQLFGWWRFQSYGYYCFFSFCELSGFSSKVNIISELLRRYFERIARMWIKNGSQVLWENEIFLPTSHFILLFLEPICRCILPFHMTAP